MKSTVKTVKTRVHEGSPSTVNIVERGPALKRENLLIHYIIRVSSLRVSLTSCRVFCILNNLSVEISSSFFKNKLHSSCKFIQSYTESEIRIVRILIITIYNFLFCRSNTLYQRGEDHPLDNREEERCWQNSPAHRLRFLQRSP